MVKKKLILFTDNYPFGIHENNFIKYEIRKLNKLFKEVEIINHRTIKKTSILDKNLTNIKLNQKFSRKVNFINILKFFFFKTILNKIFWREINFILFKKNFFKKLKMSVMELSKALILFEILKNENSNNEKIIYYSFWSNFTLISFSMLKKIHPSAKFVSRCLGSDLNGFLKNDKYVPYKKIKFSSLDSLILLGEYQKDLLDKAILQPKNINISPLGVFKQKFVKRNIDKRKIYFLSCGNLIEIKNNILMIDFLVRIAKETKKKVHFTLVGNGKLKDKIFEKLIKNKKYIDYNYYEYVNDFVKFIKKRKINFFLNFSSQEGMPFTVMETMSIGIPTISSNIKPNEYLVKDKGYVFNLSNYGRTINNTIKIICHDLENDKNYLSKCLKSYKFINKFLINAKCHKKFESILKRI